MGAVCDVTRLTGFNRALAAQGLKVMSAWGNPGPEGAAGRWRRRAGPGHGLPRRLHPRPADQRRRPDRPLRPRRAPAVHRRSGGGRGAGRGARRPERLAQGGRARGHRGGRRAGSSSDRNLDPTRPVLVVAGDGWHPGVVGIVAGRLRERYRKPVDRHRRRPRGRRRQGLGPLAAGRQPRPRRPGRLRRGPAAGRRRPRHGRGPDGAARRASPSCAPSSASAWPARRGGRRAPDALEIDALIAPAAPRPGAVRGLPAPGALRARQSRAAVRRSPTCASSGRWPCTAATSAARLADGGGGRLQGHRLARRRTPSWAAGCWPGGGGLHVAGRLKPDDWQGPRRRRARDRGRRRSAHGG